MDMKSQTVWLLLIAFLGIATISAAAEDRFRGDDRVSIDGDAIGMFARHERHEVEAKPFARRILDVPVLMYRTEDGTAVAMDDRCPHRRAPLSMGRLEGDEIECAYHGMRFNLRVDQGPIAARRLIEKPLAEQQAQSRVPTCTSRSCKWSNASPGESRRFPVASVSSSAPTFLR